NALGWLDGDVIEREQYLDFLCFRRFRQTLLCHKEVALKRPPGPEQMDRFLFSSPARQSDGKIEGHNSISIDEPQEVVARVAGAMGAAYPLPVPFEKLLACAPSRQALSEILFAFVTSGFAQFHIHDFASQAEWGERPRANRLTRWEAARGRSV